MIGKDFTGLCLCCRAPQCDCHWAFDKQNNNQHCRQHGFRVELFENIKLTEFGCESCGKHKPICSSDKFRADGAALACGHKVCKDCWPWCKICEPVPF